MMGAMTGGARAQGRGGLATPNGLATSGGDVARAPTPLRGNFIFDTIYMP